MKEENNSRIKPRDHLANERTFLAWVRTSIALMGFGFVIVKFALFLKHISILLDVESKMLVRGYSTFVGVAMVGLGIVITVLAYWEFRKVQKQLMNDKYVPSTFLPVFILVAIVLGGILLVWYLLPSL